MSTGRYWTVDETFILSSAGSLVFCFSLVCHLVALLLSSPNACRGERRGVWGRAAPIKPVRSATGILARGSVAKRAVRTTLIVFDTPALQDNACFAQVAEEFAVQHSSRSLS